MFIFLVTWRWCVLSNEAPSEETDVESCRQTERQTGEVGHWQQLVHPRRSGLLPDFPTPSLPRTAILISFMFSAETGLVEKWRSIRHPSHVVLWGAEEGEQLRSSQRPGAAVLLRVLCYRLADGRLFWSGTTPKEAGQGAFLFLSPPSQPWRIIIYHFFHFLTFVLFIHFPDGKK